jgi:glucokinase
VSGNVCRSHQIHGWENFPLREWLTDLLDAPVAVDNDANVAALGEAIHGAGAGYHPAFYFNMGSGVGGGLVAGGKIYHGRTPGESEFGHLLLQRDGTTVESRCSGWAVDARIRAGRQTEPTSILSRSIHGSAGGEARHLAEALNQNCSAAVRILDELADDLAYALSHVVHLYHPAVIVAGGGLALVGERLRSAVAERLPVYIMKAFHPVPQVKLAGLGEDAVPVGAVEMAAQLSAAKRE